MKKLLLKNLEVKEIAILTIFFLSTIYGIIPLIVFGFQNTNLNTIISELMAGILIMPVVYLILYAIYKLIFNPKEKINLYKLFDFDKFDKKYLTKFHKHLLLLFVLQYVINLVIFFIKTPETLDKAQNVQALTSIPFWLSLLIGGIFVPFLEELVYRKGIRTILKKSDKKIFYLLSALIFMFAHLQNTDNPIIMTSILISTFIVGFYLSVIYEKYGNIWVTFLTHATYNSLILFIQFFFVEFIQKLN